MAGFRAEAGKIQDEFEHCIEKERKERNKGSGEREEKVRPCQKEPRALSKVLEQFRQ